MAITIIIGTIFVIENPLSTLDSVEDNISVGTNVGDIAPSFTLLTTDGENVSLSDFRGKVVMINFWATWCPFCVDEMPDIQKVHDEFGDSLVVIGINRAESLETQETFFDELNTDFTYTLLMDSSDSTALRYGIRAMPTTFFLDGNGVITNRFFGQIFLIDMQNAIIQAGISSQIIQSPEEQIEIMETNGVKHIVPLEKLLGGGPPKDGIPSIDNPKFISAAEADEFLNTDDLVLGIEINGEAKAYPRKIVVWHEIVNDIVGGTPVAVTYCPLCFTGAAFERILDGEAVEFGVSGLLYNSDLVMYDRKTNSYWSQITGQAIVGELSGQKLTRLPLETLEWSNWKKLHPDTLVLSKDTGTLRDYNSDPYGSYYSSRTIMFPVDNKDDRIHPKAIVYGVLLNDVAKAYPHWDIEQVALLNDVVGETPIVVIFNNESGIVNIYERIIDGKTIEFKIENGAFIDTITNTIWSQHGKGLEGEYKNIQLTKLIAPPHFWFAWAAFYPETDLFIVD